jgi:hypothetical protein
MHTLAQKPKATQPSTPSKSTMTRPAHLAKSHEVGSIFHLQRTIGNQAVQKLLQAKASINTQSKVGTNTTGEIHEENDRATESTNHAVSLTADPLELEADRAADAVMRAHGPSDKPTLRATTPGIAQAKCDCAAGGGGECETCRKKLPLVQRSAAGGAAPLAAHVTTMAGRGSPLPSPVRTFMERGFGTSFADVRIHTGEDAATAARAISARAFTIGPDIAFARDAFRPADKDGQHLLAHELAHVVQQRKGGLHLQRYGETSKPSPQPQKAPSAGPVTRVRISCEDGRIIFDTGGGSYSYRLTSCNIPVGDYTVGVSVKGTTVHFDFGQAAATRERFRFGFHIDPGQVNPVTLFRDQGQVAVSVTEHLAVSQAATPTSEPVSLASRVAAFQQLVKNAGKLRLAENERVLEQWRQFLQQQLTPAQVQTQVHAEEVRALLDSASRRGGAETALAEQWLQTSGPNQRWVMQQQIEGRYRACTGCHATVQAQTMDRALAEQGRQPRTPLEQLPAAGADLGPRPAFASGEQLATGQSGAFPTVAQARERINAIQPYLHALGPEGYHVLPRETLGSTAPASELMADISRRITQRQADYREFSRRISAADFDYLQLRPIVRELLPLADADVRKAVEQAIKNAETWETVEKIVVGAAAIGLLLLTIFPPTSAIGIGGALALGTAMGAHQIYRGYQSYEQGRLYSLGRGAHDVLDPAQQEAAESLMAIGALNMIMGTVGVASGVLGTVRLIRSVAPPGGGLGALESIEATEGGNLYRVTGWGTRNPKVVVTGPNGKVIREGPLASFRPGASGGAQASAKGSSGAGGYVYPTEGGAARVAQPVPEPVPEVVPQPVIAPGTPSKIPAAPDVRGPLGAMAGATAVHAVSSLGPPSKEPVMPKGLSRTEKELWKACNELYKKYKATQDDFAEVADRMDPLKNALNQNRATPQDRLTFCALLNERIEIGERLKQRRRDYMNMDCDKFDWFNRGTTPEERFRKHEDEWGNVKASLANLRELLHKFCP